jgi:hypothetical protein
VRKLGPVGIAAVLCTTFLVVTVIGVVLSSGGGGDSAAGNVASALQPGTRSTGEVLKCPDGSQAETFFSEVGGEFRMVGRLASVDQQKLLVKGPERYVQLAIAPGAKVDPTLTGGAIVKAAGNFSDSGAAQATELQPACSGSAAAVAQLTPGPTAPPETPAATAVPVVQPAPKPAPTHAPARQPVAVVATPRPTRESGEHDRHGDDHDKKPRHGGH